MKTQNKYLSLILAALAIAFALASVRAEEFTVELGDTVAPNAPASGAGLIEDGAFTDTYTFQAEAGQIVFLEEIAIATALRNWLRWELTTPTGSDMFSQLFALQGTGRKVLPESGVYAIRFFMSVNDPAHIGDYSFRVHAVAPDQTFTIQVGDTVSKGVPGVGAGELETAGAEDRYEFSGTAGQNVFFEEIESAASFGGALRWVCLAPDGQTLFTGLFQPKGIGRRTLPQTGTYTIRFFVSDANPSHIGSYSFRLRPIAPDQTFAIELGSTIADGMPTPGAGNIETPGSQDLYTFSGTEGQSVFFEEISTASELHLFLRWECKTPSGGVLFSGIFAPHGTGRKTLPETGTYTIRCYVGNNDPTKVGVYSFRTSAIQPDANFSIVIGDLIREGESAPGSGKIETPGSQDVYTFAGMESQRVIFEELGAENALAGALRWELKASSGATIFSRLFSGSPSQLYALPETGTYSLRLFVGETGPQYIGTYSFFTFSPVQANPDFVMTSPDTPFTIPFTSLLCNDTHEAVDTVGIELPIATSAQGGSMTTNASGIIYSPAPGFSGFDTFDYRVRGHYGGISTTRVTIQISPAAQTVAAVVSLSITAAGAAELCLLGLPSSSYTIEESTDFQAWDGNGTLTSDDLGRLNWTFSPGSESARFYRFHKSP